MVKKLLYETLQSIALALAIYTIVNYLLLQPNEVEGESMEPNLHNFEYLLTEKISYRFDKPARGDIVVINSPQTDGKNYIKRTIGLPGETVSLNDGKVFINDKQLIENYLPDTTMTFGGPLLAEGNKLTLRENEYFVMGDNRGHSKDSRYIGPIDRKYISGRAWLIYWEFKYFGTVKKASY